MQKRSISAQKRRKRKGPHFCTGNPNGDQKKRRKRKGPHFCMGNPNGDQKMTVFGPFWFRNDRFPNGEGQK